MSGRRHLRVLAGVTPAAGPPSAMPPSCAPALAAQVLAAPPSSAPPLAAPLSAAPTLAAPPSAAPLLATPLAAHRRGFVSAALAAAGSWLVEPASPPPEATSNAPSPWRPVIAVFGLARGCGVTVVSRALAAELASRDVEGAAAVHCEVRGAGIPLATHAATRLARALAEVPGADTRAVGRLCLVRGAERDALAHTARHFAPLVLDAGSTHLGGAPAALADRVILVTTAAIEPALAPVAAECLARVGPGPVVVVNRVPDGDAPDHRPSGDSIRAVHALPESRMGAQLALGGREPRGELGRAISELADMCEEPR